MPLLHSQEINNTLSLVVEVVDDILSRNIADFKQLHIPTYTPEQFFLL